MTACVRFFYIIWKTINRKLLISVWNLVLLRNHTSCIPCYLYCQCNLCVCNIKKFILVILLWQQVTPCLKTCILPFFLFRSDSVLDENVDVKDTAPEKTEVKQVRVRNFLFSAHTDTGSKGNLTTFHNVNKFSESLWSFVNTGHSIADSAFVM